jgi:hypothetical protein
VAAGYPRKPRLASPTLPAAIRTMFESRAEPSRVHREFHFIFGMASIP